MTPTKTTSPVPAIPVPDDSCPNAEDLPGPEPEPDPGGDTLAPIAIEPLTDLLLGSFATVRREARDRIARHPELHRVEGETTAEHRARVLAQAQRLVDLRAVQRAWPERLGGADDPGGNIASFEELIFADPSLQIKAGVQWGLFGAAVLHLGTLDHHDRLLPPIISLAMPGAFAMTETGHGSDVAGLATTATYDPHSETFDLHTPHRAAWKDYIGNAALHGRAAVVFAQLVSGGEQHGVHAFYVPLRDDTGAFLPGIGGEDDGLKGGLNGVDNGRLHFTHVAVPRVNLLNRYGDVAPDGTYSSPIASPGRRFFTMLGTLVQGRVSLDGSAVLAAEIGLTVAIRYGNERRQFTASSEVEEEVLLDYQQHQVRLIPKLATTFAQVFAHDELLCRFDAVFRDPNPSDADRQDLETMAAALKPLSTWHALATLQECREACGGQGYLAENRLVGLRQDFDIATTFEGDNTVLLQLVAKRLLADYVKRCAGAHVGALARMLVTQVTDRAFRGMGLRRMVQTVADFGSTARSVHELCNPEVQRDLLAGRVAGLIAEVAVPLGKARHLDRAAAAGVVNAHQHVLIEAARAHGHLLQWEAFTRVLEGDSAAVADPATRIVLTRLRDLFGLGRILEHLDWYLIQGTLSPQRARSLRAYVCRLCEHVRPHVGALVDAFGFAPELVRAPIAAGTERARVAAAHGASADEGPDTL